MTPPIRRECKYQERHHRISTAQRCVLARFGDRYIALNRRTPTSISAGTILICCGCEWGWYFLYERRRRAPLHDGVEKALLLPAGSVSQDGVRAVSLQERYLRHVFDHLVCERIPRFRQLVSGKVVPASSFLASYSGGCRQKGSRTWIAVLELHKSQRTQ